MTVSRIQAVEAFSEMIPARVQEKLSDLANALTLDEWIEEHLSEEDNAMYKALMQLRYQTKEQYPVRLKDLASALGYTGMQTAQDRLERDFLENSEFCLLKKDPERPRRGGQNAKNYALTLKCAQKFAVNCHTEQGKKVAAFFVETVEVLQDYHKLTLLRDERRKGLQLRHEVLIKQNPRIAGFSACYIAIVGVLDNVCLVKLGRSDDIKERMNKLKQTFGECFLYDVIVVRNGLDLENKLKADAFLQKHHLEKEDLPDALKSQTELYKAGDFPLVDKFGTAIRSLTKELTTAQEAEWIHKERIKELDIEATKAQTDATKAQTELLKTLKDVGVSPADVKEILARNGIAKIMPGGSTMTITSSSQSAERLQEGHVPPTAADPLERSQGSSQEAPQEGSPAPVARPATTPAPSTSVQGSPSTQPISPELTALLDEFVDDWCDVSVRLKETSRYLNEAWPCFTSEKNTIVKPLVFRKYMKQRFVLDPNNLVVRWDGGSDKGKGYRGLALKADARQKTGLQDRVTKTISK